MHVFDWLYISLCRHRSVKLTWCISACLLSLPFVLSVCMCASAEVCGMDALTNLQIGCFMSSPRSSSNSLPPVLPLPHWMCVCVCWCSPALKGAAVSRALFCRGAQFRERQAKPKSVLALPPPRLWVTCLSSRVFGSSVVLYSRVWPLVLLHSSFNGFVCAGAGDSAVFRGGLKGEGRSSLGLW